ncbi:MAG: hypothetical protein ABIG95_05500 [Candidatus Woesearchaeota archaeon]
MRVTNQTMYDIVEEVIGKDAVAIIEYLKDRKNISDFKIAEKVNMNMQQVRNLLYQLHAHNLVRYIRKKDRVKGWYISYFTFNKEGIKDLIDKVKAEKLEVYRQRLEKEASGKLFFMCPNFCVRLDFDQSIELDYKCPECGSLLKQQDNAKTIDKLKEKIAELEAS